MQRPKLCSEQSLFKQSLTGNLAPLTHSDSTLLRKKKEEQEPALGRVSRQELAPGGGRLSTMACALNSPQLQSPEVALSPRPAKEEGSCLLCSASGAPVPHSRPLSSLCSSLPFPSLPRGTLGPVSTAAPPPLLALLPIWLSGGPYRTPGIPSS